MQFCTEGPIVLTTLLRRSASVIHRSELDEKKVEGAPGDDPNGKGNRVCVNHGVCLGRHKDKTSRLTADRLQSLKVLSLLLEPLHTKRSRHMNRHPDLSKTRLSWVALTRNSKPSFEGFWSTQLYPPNVSVISPC